MDNLLAEINQALKKDEQVILLRVVEVDPNFNDPNLLVGNKRLLLTDKSIGTLGNSTLDIALDEEAKFHSLKQNLDTFCLWTDKFSSPQNSDFVEKVKTSNAARIRVSIEIIRPQPCLVICGAGHIARALTQLGLILGFRSIVIDDRSEFASRTYFPDNSIDLRAEDFVSAIKSINFSLNMFVVIVTRGHKHDEDCLRELLKCDVGYLGMIGSRRRITVVKEKLLDEGFLAEKLSKIYAPIGLDIGARTPEEIALTILAEIVLVRNRGRSTVDCSPLSRLVLRDR